MTTRELRKMLFEVVNQELTIKELRDILFQVEDQDKELTDTAIKRLTYKK